jgi:hypothetical protein
MTDISTQTEPKKMIDVNTLTAAEMEDMCEDQEAMEELYKMYDEMLEREADETPQYIGYCGFPCDGYCSECGGRATFDMADEI